MSLRSRPARALFAVTILIGSFLLFLIQPMVARMALPRLGGAPNVWNSAMLVYQALLLGGYGYAHWLGRFAIRRQATIHLALLLLAVPSLPVGLAALAPPTPGWEALWVPALLAVSIGPVFFLVSAQAPLLQRWYFAAPGASQPWALYAASNLGSFGGLLAYPLLAEPLLALPQQAWAWSAGFAALILLTAASAAMRWTHARDTASTARLAPIPRRTLALWLALAAVPSGLMLSTTTHLTTDIFAMPLLWVIPLGLYLASMSLAFADRRGPARIVSALAWPVMLFGGALAMISRGDHGLIPVLVSVVLLFVVCVALHSRLYDLRPAPERLTAFYLAMAAGGALGGLFTALIAPLLFDWAWEHPLLVLAAAALLPQGSLPDWTRRRGMDRILTGTVVVLAVSIAGILLWRLYDVSQLAEPGPRRWLPGAALALVGLALIPWRGAVLALLLAAMIAEGGHETIAASREGIRHRSYFGIHTVRTYPELKLRLLAHGTTVHGEQYTDPARRRLPLTYYAPQSGAAQVFTRTDTLFGPRARIGVLGLGAGTLACFARPGQSWRFFEIDPVVVRLSRGGTFTYYNDCTPGAPIVLGDARLQLARVPRGSFDLLAIDAFSSDSVPLHLFTHEAFGIYLDALSARGVMMVNISNRFIDLEPALSAEIAARGLHALARDDNPEGNDEWYPSSWVMVSRDADQLKRVAHAPDSVAWRELVNPAPRVWSDAHASVLPHVIWSNLVKQ